MSEISLKSRIEYLISKGFSQSDLAKIADVKPSSVFAWLSGKTQKISSDIAYRLAKETKVSLTWLSSGIGDPETSNVIVADDDVNNSEYVTIKEYNICFGAGEAEEPTYDEIEDAESATYRRTFFERSKADPRYCRRFHVTGDSMEPLIQDGDCITVDCTPNQPIIDNHIYAIAYDHTLRVKRLIKKLKGLSIISDNPKYPPEELTPEEANQYIHIIGRVLDRSGRIN